MKILKKIWSILKELNKLIFGFDLEEYSQNNETEENNASQSANFEKLKDGIHTGGASLYMDFPMVWGENIVFLQHFLENNKTIDRFYITSNFNSNVQLIVEIVLNDIFRKEKERFLLNVLKKLKEKE